MKKGRILAALLCLCMTLTLLPHAALAATATSVIVGGVTLDGTTNVYATTDSVTGEVTPQPGYGESDPWNVKFQNGVLTLNNATVAGSAQQYDTSSLTADCGIYAAGELKLVLVGRNTVYSKDGADVRAGIRIRYLDAVGDARLTIEGDGSLHAYAAAGGDHVHEGILVNGFMTINSGTITAEGRSTDGNSYGVFAVSGINMTGGSLTATGGDVTGNYSSRGVISNGSITVSGGTLIATGGTASSSYGVSSGAAGGLIINASAEGQVKVTAKTTDTSGSAYRRAFNNSPVIRDGACYTWSLTENDPNPTSSAATPYVWERSQTFTELTLGQAVATPTFSPAAETYADAQTVSISCATADATIHYTTDGTEPNEESPAYGAEIPVSYTTTVKAKAYKSGMSASETASATYDITATVAKITVTPAAASVIKGGTQSFSAAVEGSGLPPQSKILWAVQGKSAASTAISADGVLTVSSDETAKTLTVTATSTADVTKSGTATVTVISPDVSVASVTLDRNTLYIGSTAKRQLIATVLPAEATNRELRWTSTNPAVATVTNKGVVVMKASGQTVIRVTTVDGGYTAECRVTVIRGISSLTMYLNGQALKNPWTSLSVGDTGYLSAMVDPYNAGYKNLTWLNSTPNILSFDKASGRFVALAPGKGLVQVWTQDGSAIKKWITVVVK